MMLSAINGIKSNNVLNLNLDRTAALYTEQNVGASYLHIVGRMMTASVRLGA